ncbi:epididymal protein 13 [Diceros bicornis minor]|uniref:epididymal protein 13 n=1 Tax=Diceros bicornis minor TaxID=77932 RepID=UPI0026EE751E|nr:epididymal protein 13 [Diceros bicornis minor]
MRRSEPFLKMPLLILLFVGSAEACVPREGLLSLQVLSEETNGCKEEVKLPPTIIPTKKPQRRGGWSLMKCAYMMITFLFVSYNKGDWCYCHRCNTEVDIRTQRMTSPRKGRRASERCYHGDRDALRNVHK